jgi:hypothetical protein
MISLSAAAGDGIDHWTAEFRRSVAAVLHEEGEQITESSHVGRVSDAAALALGADEPSLQKHFQMCRRGVLDSPEPVADLPGRKALGTCLHKQPKRREAGFLAEGRKRIER